MKRRKKLTPRREGHLTTIIITRHTTFIIAFAILLFTFTAVFFSSFEDIRRMVYGVKPKVALETRKVSGYLPDEVRRIVEIMADQERAAAKDAMLFKETGELIPEEPGLDIDVDSTVDKVMKAKPGEIVKLSRIAIAPAVTTRHFDPVYRVNTTRQIMAFAINLAWGEEYLPSLFRGLREQNIKVTFFIDGEWAEKFPDIVRYISAEGHEVASHGYRHVHVERMGESEIRKLISDNDKLLVNIGVTPSPLFAPPYGECNSTIVSAGASLGYTTIMWTIDTIDWNTKDSQKILNRVIPKITPGAIILAHPTSSFLEAFPKIVDASREAGYGFMTISDLISSK